MEGIRFVEFNVAKTNNRVVLRVDQIVFYGETPNGIEIALADMDGSVTVEGTIDTVTQALMVH